MTEYRPDSFVSDYTGQPGERTFFLQARGGGPTLSFLVEKGQVIALAEQLREMLLVVNGEDPVSVIVPARDPAAALETPVEPEWRVGTISIGFIEEDDLVVIALHPAEDEGLLAEQDDIEARFLISRDLARAFVGHALATAAEGRPICQLCGLPMDPEGHKCPASNGHRLA